MDTYLVSARELMEADNDFSELLRTRSRSETSPIVRLLLAVMEDAVEVFLKRVNTPRQNTLVFREAKDWIACEGTRHPISFENVCLVLGYNADYLREHLLAHLDRTATQIDGCMPVETDCLTRIRNYRRASS